MGEGILLEELTLPDGITAVGNPKARAIAVAASRLTAKAAEAGDSVAPAEASTEAPAAEKKED